MKRRLTTIMAAALLALGMLAGPAAAAGHPPEGPGKAHASVASVLKGDTASIMPGHVAGDRANAAHASIASVLKGATADEMPEHVRRN